MWHSCFCLYRSVQFFPSPSLFFGLLLVVFTVIRSSVKNMWIFLASLALAVAVPSAGRDENCHNYRMQRAEMTLSVWKQWKVSTVCASLRSFPFLFRPTFQPISILLPHSSLFSYALVVLEDCTQTPLHRLYTHNPSLCKAKHLGKLLAYPLNPLTQTHYHEFCIIYASASTLSRAYASGRYHCQHLYLCWRRVFSSSQFEKWRQKM